jgi:prepilin-type N-terminal cleavage/methylation domain-containing protein
MFVGKFQTKKSLYSTRGFTLYELLISFAIISIIAGIVLYNHRRFETDIEVTNLAYRMAVEIRQAQVYGISVRQHAGAGLLGFDVAYGVHFETDVNDSFILFADGDGNGLYNPAVSEGSTDCPTDAGTECVEKFSIGRNNKIIGWCGILWSNTADVTQQCFVPNSQTDYKFFDIKFKRPNPDAIFSWYKGSYDEGSTSSAFNRACSDGGVDKACNGYAICLESPQGRRKRVVVYETGQISVENVEVDTTCSNI